MRPGEVAHSVSRGTFWLSLEKVAALLGHSNLNTTRIYITPSEQDLEKAVEQPLFGNA